MFRNFEGRTRVNEPGITSPKREGGVTKDTRTDKDIVMRGVRCLLTIRSGVAGSKICSTTRPVAYLSLQALRQRLGTVRDIRHMFTR